jgi:hypothetical protein
MSVATGVGISLFLYMLAIVDGIVNFFISIIWLFSLFSTTEGLSWYWFWKSLWVSFFGIIFALGAIATAMYTATTAVTDVATNIQVNTQQEQQQVPVVKITSSTTSK